MGKTKKTYVNLVGSSGTAKPGGRKKRVIKSRSRKKAGTGRTKARGRARSTR